ncbi:MAG: helix-hairpin-helix domain-containing protein [Deltaproteobacteria bacterium]|nr:helix-hairpin-helix domain-containing protein [Deltaproteobacteria bacterium]
MASSFESAWPTRTSTMRNVFAYVFLGLVLAAGVAFAEPAPARAPLDLNRATAEELETLPGIGAAKAAAILAARDAQGGFSSLDELEAVRGIGPALMAKLRPLVVVGGGTGKAPAGSAGGKPAAPGATR